MEKQMISPMITTTYKQYFKGGLSPPIFLFFNFLFYAKLKGGHQSPTHTGAILKIQTIVLGKSIHLYVPFLSRCVFGFRGYDESSFETSFSYGITHGQALFNSFNKYLYSVNEDGKALSMIVLERFNLLTMSWKPNCCLSPSLVNLNNTSDRADFIGMSMIMMDGDNLTTDKREIESVKEFLEEENKPTID